MAKLFSQYASGVQLTAGPITGSAAGVSGLNPIVDRINSVAPDSGTISGASVDAPLDYGEAQNSTFASGTSFNIAPTQKDYTEFFIESDRNDKIMYEINLDNIFGGGNFNGWFDNAEESQIPVNNPIPSASNVVDISSGTNFLGLELNPNSFLQYLQVDII